MLHALVLFVKYTGLSDHEALKTSHLELGQVDFNRIGNSIVTEREYILFEIIRMLTTGTSSLLLSDLHKLSADDITAFTYTLQAYIGLNKVAENL
jgi:hypothetical protein